MFSISRIHQVLQAIPRGAFEQSVQRHGADRFTKGFGSWQHLVAMVYAQLSGAASLRQLEAGLNANPRQHYHLGVGNVRRSTLAEANARRTPAVFAELLQLLITQAGRAARRQRKELHYLLDASLVDLPYVGARMNARVHPAMKMHVLLHAPSAALAHVSITSSRVDDKVQARQLALQAGATYVFDRGYCDYGWWHEIGQHQARFVTRFKRNAALRVVRELQPQGEAVARDSIVAFAIRRPRAGHINPYSTTLRRIEVRRADAAPLVLATNDMDSPAEDIAAMYKQRWLIELLFKWVKQHLGIRSFLGRNENAVRIQILTALITYMLVLLLKQRTGFKNSLWMLLAELRSSLFQRPRTDEAYCRRRTMLRESLAAVQPVLL